MTHAVLLPLIIVWNMVVPMAGLTYMFDGHVFDMTGALHTPCHELIFIVDVTEEPNWLGDPIDVARITIDYEVPETACEYVFTPFEEHVELDVDVVIVNGQEIWRK